MNKLLQFEDGILASADDVEILKNKENAKILSHEHSKIEFKDVCFEYIKNKPVLKNINQTDINKLAIKLPTIISNNIHAIILAPKFFIFFLFLAIFIHLIKLIILNYE